MDLSQHKKLLNSLNFTDIEVKSGVVVADDPQHIEC